jgi:hypothetical protein
MAYLRCMSEGRKQRTPPDIKSIYITTRGTTPHLNHVLYLRGIARIGLLNKMPTLQCPTRYRQRDSLLRLLAQKGS